MARDRRYLAELHGCKFVEVDSITTCNTLNWGEWLIVFAKGMCNSLPPTRGPNG